MPSLLRHFNSSVLLVIFDKQQLHPLFTWSNMKISKAPELLKKAVTVFKIKTEVLHTKLLILASLRRRMALVGAVSRRIQSFVSSDDGREKPVRVEYAGKALVVHKAVMAASPQGPAVAADDYYERDDGVIDLSEVALFYEDDHRYSLFYDSESDTEGDHHDYGGVLDTLGEPSVIDIIRSNREVQGLEFNMDDEIDEACDMFIRKFRKRMNTSL